MSFDEGASCQGVPVVSVVMTTFNGEAYLKDQIDSILNQSFSDFELIISDDGSKDSTIDILRDYEARDPRIRILEAESNLGLHRNLEKAFSYAKGKFIAISDQDDVWESGKIEDLLDVIGDADGAFCNSLLVDSSGKSLGTNLLKTLKVDPLKVAGIRPCAISRYNIVSGHALLFRRELLDAAVPFDNLLVFDQQIAFHALCGRGIKYLDKCLVNHRIHENNHTNGGLIKGDGASKSKKKATLSMLDTQAPLRKYLLSALQYLDAHATGGEKAIGIRLVLLRRIIIKRIERYEHAYIDFGLLFLLYFCRASIFHEWEKSKLKKCFKLSKGGQYYKRKARRRSLA